MMRVIIALVTTLSLFIGITHADDLAWMSLTPGGDPLEYFYVEPNQEFTLWAVLYNESEPAHEISFPIMYDPLLEVTDYCIDSLAFNFMGWCGIAYAMFQHHDPANMYLTWHCYTAVYQCEVPQGSQQSVGYVTFRCLGPGITYILEGLSPTGYPIFYTNADSHTDYYPTFIPLMIEQGIGTNENTAIDVPSASFLAPASPCPFRANTSISYGVEIDQQVNLTVYNTSGQSVKTLVNDVMKAGRFEVTWDGRDDTGQRLPSGVYFVKMKTESFRSEKKVVLKYE
jgi:hypothetical protein